MQSFPLIVSGFLALFAVTYLLKHQNHPADKYVPTAAWLRAGIYFCFCYLVAWYSGALPTALASPIATPEQTSNPIWRTWVFGLTVLITVGYWIIWARFTIRFDRKLELIPQIIFGLAWGIAAGFLFLSFWHLVKSAGPELPIWAVWLISYLMISVWQWLWQDYGWDVYISPEHDCPWSIAVKVPATHIPNVTFCLIFFAIYENYWIFVALQTWALLGASIAMRMPSPWCQDETPAARRVPGLFGASRARAAGYHTPNPQGNIYVRSTGLPAGTAVWVLGAHVFALLIPLAMLALVQINLEHLETVLYEPRLLFLAACLMMAGGAIEIIQNSFAHHWYIGEERPGYFETVFGTLACLAMATMITACYGNYSWVILVSYLLAIAYPIIYLLNTGRGMIRAILGSALVVAMYYRLGDPIVFLSLFAVFFSIYFYQLLHRTKAQAFHGGVAAVSAFGMVCIPWAIYNNANGTSTSPLMIWICAAVLLVGATLLWPRLRHLQPTPNAHQN
jgi:hypothetical protein